MPKKKQNNKEAQPKVEVINTQNDSKKVYVVLRGGRRVSDKEYENASAAQSEWEFWDRVTTRYPDGSKSEIVPIDKK
jgi:hypothetical protein